MIQRLVLKLIRFYQRVLSPLKPPSCRFHPTCSHYTYHAIERFGILQGSWLGLKRLCRCHPWHPGGYDPVPEKVSAQPQTSHQETELSHKELDEQ